MQEMIADGTIMVDVTGEEVGQINGLAVLDLGDYHVRPALPHHRARSRGAAG